MAEKGGGGRGLHRIRGWSSDFLEVYGEPLGCIRLSVGLIQDTLTPYCNSLRISFSTYKGFWADPAHFFYHTLQESWIDLVKGLIHGPQENYYSQGFYKELAPYLFFPPFFFKLYLTQRFSADLLKKFAIYFKGLRRTLMRISWLKNLLSEWK